MNLHELQKEFLDYLYQGSNEITDAIDETFLARLSIYRNNVSSGIINYLKEVFPVIEKLVGADFFEAMCEQFLAQEHPQCGDLHQFGGTFSQFMENFAPLAALPYLPDVARLEWFHHRAYYAEEHPALNLSLSQEELLNCEPKLNASVSLLRSPYPVDTIWQQARENTENFNVDLNSGSVIVLVFRHQQQVQVWNLSESAAALLETVNSGHRLGSAIETAFVHPGSEALPEFISQCLQKGIVCQPYNSQTNR